MNNNNLSFILLYTTGSSIGSFCSLSSPRTPSVLVLSLSFCSSQSSYSFFSCVYAGLLLFYIYFLLLDTVHKVRHPRGGRGPRRCDSLYTGTGSRACDVTLIIFYYAYET